MVGRRAFFANLRYITKLHEIIAKNRGHFSGLPIHLGCRGHFSGLLVGFTSVFCRVKYRFLLDLDFHPIWQPFARKAFSGTRAARSRIGGPPNPGLRSNLAFRQNCQIGFENRASDKNRYFTGQKTEVNGIGTPLKSSVFLDDLKKGRPSFVPEFRERADLSPVLTATTKWGRRISRARRSKWRSDSGASA